MTNTSPFVRKVIYIAIIGALLVPLSMISRPETRDLDGKIDDAGGQLSKLRNDYNLSQANLSDIDPASETMKLASLGLRGVAVNMLWMQAMEHKKKENYDQLASTLQALTKIQPNFVKVWEYQAHNLAYNVSMEFDDYEYRYTWVKKGLEFLKKGIAYNKRDHRVPDNLGFFVGNKFGKSDEKDSFRRIFRKDTEFHDAMSDYIDPEKYDQRGYGPDSWLMAHEWYEYSRKMVEEQSCPQRRNDMLFHMYRPSQIRNQAMSLQVENRSDEIIQEIWRSAFEKWVEYGNREISNTLGVTIKMEGLKQDQDKIAKIREELDKLVRPGLRAEMIEDIMAQSNFSEEDKALMKMSAEELPDMDLRRYQSMKKAIENLSSGIDAEIANEVENEENLVTAQKFALEIATLNEQIKTIYKDSSTVNYSYWRARNEAESTDLCVQARQALWDAEKMWRQSIYDDEFDFDFKTKEKTVIKLGAISLYLDAFQKWQEVYDAGDKELMSGVMATEMVETIKKFEDMLNLTNRPWPENFPLQRFIDYRWTELGIGDGLMTSELIEEMKSGQEDPRDRDEDEMDKDDSDKSTDATDEKESDDSEKESEGDVSDSEKEKSDEN
jgi:hypothetical protein